MRQRGSVRQVRQVRKLGVRSQPSCQRATATRRVAKRSRQQCHANVDQAPSARSLETSAACCLTSIDCWPVEARSCSVRFASLLTCFVTPARYPASTVRRNYCQHCSSTTCAIDRISMLHVCWPPMERNFFDAKTLQTRVHPFSISVALFHMFVCSVRVRFGSVRAGTLCSIVRFGSGGPEAPHRSNIEHVPERTDV